MVNCRVSLPFGELHFQLASHIIILLTKSFIHHVFVQCNMYVQLCQCVCPLNKWKYIYDWKNSNVCCFFVCFIVVSLCTAEYGHGTDHCGLNADLHKSIVQVCSEYESTKYRNIWDFNLPLYQNYYTVLQMSIVALHFELARNHQKRKINKISHTIQIPSTRYFVWLVYS
jgi:hypothetical protein